MVLGNNVLKTFFKNAGPASIDMTLAPKILVPNAKRGAVIRLGESIRYRIVEFTEAQPYILMPGEFVLGATREKVQIPTNMCAFVNGRSSIGRIGLTVQNAGFVDPGFEGTITLELVNESRHPIGLIPGYRVAQLVLLEVKDNETPYTGKYQGQIDPTGSRMYLDPEARKRK